MQEPSGVVYRNLTQAELDREYNARESVPSFDAEYARYVAESERAKQSIPHHADVIYDDRTGEAMDIYPGEPGAPVFLWVHGGYWRALSKDDNAFAVAGVVARGLAAAVPNYTLAPAVTLDEIVRQVRKSLAFLSRNRSSYGIGPRPIMVGGSSAGGHLVGMLLAGGWHEEFGVPDDVIGSALALSGLYELEPLRHTHVNGWINLDEPAARRNSPLALIPLRSSTKLIASVGGLETAEFRRQTVDYAKAWAAAGHSIETIEMPEHNHFDIALSLREPNGPLVNAIMDAVRGK